LVFGAAGLKKYHERRKFVVRDSAREGRHVVAAVVDPDNQLVFTEAIAHAAEIGTALPAITIHLVAIDASFTEEHLGAVTDGRIGSNWNRIRDGLGGEVGR